MSRVSTGSPLVIAGMHRSGTSLVASALQAAGVDLGANLIGPTGSNPRGHFEDASVVDWHDAVLRDHGLTWYEAGTGVEIRVSRERRAEATDLLARKASAGIWGWKDPRTCLFLDFWLELLPDARFLFVHRDPALVLDSLRRRQDPELFHRFRGVWALKRLGFDAFRARKALDLWLRHNRAIVDFMEAHPARCRLVEAARLDEQLPSVVRGLREAGLGELGDVDIDGLRDRSLLRDASSRRIPAGRDARRAGSVRSRLRELAGTPPLA